MIKTKIKPVTVVRYLAVATVTSVLLSGFLPHFSGAQSVEELQQQIDALNNEISQSQSRIGELRQRGDTLQNRLDVLNAEARQLQSEIDLTQQEINRTQVEIKEIETNLQRTKELIQENVKVLYKYGNPSTLEVLFSSNNFTEFINRQEYLDRVKTSLNEAARESVLLKQELEAKETELTVQFGELEGQQRQLSVKQEEQRQLVAETRGEENRYQDLVKRQQEERKQLEREQAELMAAAAAARGGGPDYSGFSAYPWPNENMNYNDNCIYPDGNRGDDPWGYCLRQCTSYVAWMLHKDDASGFTYLGHAKSWKHYGQPIHNFQNARRGDVLVWDIGTFGHVMYVEAKTGAGLSISQFNVPFGSGVYSTDFYTWNELSNGVGGASFYLRRF